ncbi:MAG: hypothetical protein D6698_14030 [Gammaproteobacteria bacterium]|nr:MAG: hypothetical protein D6698_14030 [Gammaproteobacteria bacterium]
MQLSILHTKAQAIAISIGVALGAVGGSNLIQWLVSEPDVPVTAISIRGSYPSSEEYKWQQDTVLYNILQNISQQYGKPMMDIRNIIFVDRPRGYKRVWLIDGVLYIQKDASLDEVLRVIFPTLSPSQRHRIVSMVLEILYELNSHQSLQRQSENQELVE